MHRPSHKKKKKTDRTLHASSEPVIDTHENPNDISISNVETESGNKHEPSDNVNDDVHVDAQPSNDNDVEVEPAVDLDNPQSKNQHYDKRDFISRKHGFRNPCPFLLNHPRKRMMRILSALLKCLDLSFCVCV